MAIEFVCPACGGTLQVGDEAAGRVIRCGGCMTALRVPVPDPSPRSAPPPPSAPTSPFETDAPAPAPRARRTSSRGSAEAEPVPNEDALPTAHRVDPRRGPEDPSAPRRRRRPPPPAASGSKVLVWLLVIGAIGFFGLIACCGLFALVMSGNAKWHAHDSARGGFKVDLPGPMTTTAEQPAHLELEKGERSEGALLPFKQQQYVVIYKDIPSTKERAAKNERTDKEEIDDQINKLLKAPGANKLEDKTVTVGGFPAREIEMRCAGGWYTVRVIVADTRAYTLVVHSDERPNKDDVRRFIDSFTITDEKIVAEGKRRETQEKKGGAGLDLLGKAIADKEGERKRPGD
jgi:hypothetical protein